MTAVLGKTLLFFSVKFMIYLFIVQNFYLICIFTYLLCKYCIFSLLFVPYLCGYFYLYLSLIYMLVNLTLNLLRYLLLGNRLKHHRPYILMFCYSIELPSYI